MQLVASLQVITVALSCFLSFSAEAKTSCAKDKPVLHRAAKVSTAKKRPFQAHNQESLYAIATVIGKNANKLTHPEVGLSIPSLASAPNWDVIAADSIKLCQPLAGYSYSLREMIDSAANDTAHIAQAPEILKTPEVMKVQSPSVVIMPTVPAAPTIVIPRIDKAEAETSYAPLPALSVDRPETIAKADAEAVARDERRNRNRKKIAVKDATKSNTSMRIVPPMPTMQMKNKANPFIDANINFTRPLMLGVPH